MRAAAVAFVLAASVAGAQTPPAPSTAAPAATTAPSSALPAPMTATAMPSSSDVDIAKAHFNTGQAYYEHGRFADAAREFEEAYRLSGKAALLYNTGKSYDGANDYARALDAYERFLAAASDDSLDRPFVVRRVELLHALVGSIVVDGAVAGSTVTLDQKSAGATPLPRPLAVNPGRHQLELAREGYATFRAAVDVPVGGSATVAARQIESVKVVTVVGPSAPADVPVYKRWWLWAAVGGAVVVAGVVTAVVVTSSSSTSTLPTVQLPQVK